MSLTQYKIKCPKCGAEYLPAEIFFPDEFLGKPKNIIKDLKTGQINGYSGQSMVSQSNYICDFCNTPFIVNAQIKFSSEIDELHDYENDYTEKFLYGQLERAAREKENNDTN